MIFFWMLAALSVVFIIFGYSTAFAIFYSAACICVLLVDIIKELKRINK